MILIKSTLTAYNFLIGDIVVLNICSNSTFRRIISQVVKSLPLFLKHLDKYMLFKWL